MLFIRDSAESDWRSYSEGLPRNLYQVSSASTLINIDTNELLAGFRGIALRNFDTGYSQPGGIYRSIDAGTSWKQCTINIGYNPYVWQILRSGSLLFATVSRVSSSTGLQGLSTDSAVIVRSTDSGLNWYVVYRFSESASLANHTGHRMARGSDGRLFVLGKGQVVVGNSDGTSWYTLEDSFGQDECLSDVTVDSDTTIWVASNLGLYHIRSSPVTDVYVVKDNERYTSVWGYPTPVQEIMTIRLNNVDLIDVNHSQLKVFDVYGTEVDDLTNTLRNASGSRRFEFAYSVANLSAGLYFLKLEVSSSAPEIFSLVVVK